MNHLDELVIQIAQLVTTNNKCKKKTTKQKYRD